MITTKALLWLSTLAFTKTVLGSSYSNNYNNYDNSGGYSTYSSYSDAYGVNFFAESTNTQYDGYQQAWRYLGWYVACGHPSDRYYQKDGHSHDSHDNNNKRYQGNMYCQRYLMWAAVSSPLLDMRILAMTTPPHVLFSTHIVCRSQLYWGRYW